MNKVILMGRMTRDAEVRYTQGENSSAVARFTLAVDRRFKRQGDEQTADFISCVAFGKTAEFIEKYGHQGTKFVVEGRIQTGSYTNKDGIKVYLDESLKRFETVYPAAGNDHSAVRLTIAELEDVAGACGWIDVCKEREKVDCR